MVAQRPIGGDHRDADVLERVGEGGAVALPGEPGGDPIPVGVDRGDDDVENNDATWGWAWRLGDAVGAEIGCVGFGNLGFTTPGSGGVPIAADSFHLLREGRPRSFVPAPDVVVVNLGTNDHTRSRAGAGAAARRFLRTLAAACPSSRILVLAPFGGQLPELAEAACGVPRVRYVPTDGWWDPADAGDGVHPYGYANARDIVPRLAPLVAAALGAR